MLSKLIEFVLSQRVFVLVMTAALCAFGYRAVSNLPIEAFPDVQDVQVLIVTQYPGQAPEEVERNVTLPIEREMSGVPRQTQLRSVTISGLSVVTLTFGDGTDDYFARQQVLEKLQNVNLPQGVQPQLAPLTTAGMVAQGLAESMASCALTQLVRPGSPAILASFFSSMSLRSGSPTFGTPEPAIGSLAMGQLARRLNLPLRCAGNFSTSKLPDGQAMQQSMMSMMSAVQGGANYVLHSAGFLDGLLSMSYEKMVMDMDMCGALHAYLDGMAVDDDALAFEALAELGPGQHLFSTQHTLRHYETAYWDSALDDNQPWETWDEQGGIDSAQRANARWKKLLREYEAPPLDVALDEALLDFMARRKQAMPDMWY